MLKFWNKKLLNFGLHLGSSIRDKEKFNDHFSIGIRNNCLIFNVANLINILTKINNLISTTIFKNGQILFIENRAQEGFKDIAESASNRCQEFFVGDWLFGGLTNNSMVKLVNMDKKINKQYVQKIPSLIFLPNLGSNDWILNEAYHKNIPILGYVNNTNQSNWLATYGLPGNSNSILSLFFFCTFIEMCVIKANYHRNRSINSILFKEWLNFGKKLKKNVHNQVESRKSNHFKNNVCLRHTKILKESTYNKVLKNNLF